MNSGVRDGYRYFFVLCGGCAPGTPRLREDEKVLAEPAEIAEENNKSA